MRHLSSLQNLAGLSLLLPLGLAGCTAKEDAAPATGYCYGSGTTDCSELVTVRPCASYGDVPNCAAIHSMLQLANGYYVIPSGAVWQAYQPHQMNGQTLRVGYQLAPPLPPNVDGIRGATITCLEVVSPGSNPAAKSN